MSNLPKGNIEKGGKRNDKKKDTTPVEKRGIISKVSDIFLLVTNKIFHMKKDPYFLRYQKLMTILCNVAFVLVAIIFAVLRVYKYIKDSQTNDMIGFIANFGFLLLWTLNGIAFLVHRRLGILFFFFVAISVPFGVVLHYITGRGLNSIAIHCVYCVLFCVVVVRPKICMVYIVLCLLTTAVIHVIDSVFLAEVDDLRYANITRGVVLETTWAILVSFMLINHLISNKNTKLLEECCKGISTLEFDTPPIKKLKKKESSLCPKVLILMKQIIKNFEIYASYLPESLKLQACHSSYEDSSSTIDDVSSEGSNTVSILSSQQTQRGNGNGGSWSQNVQRYERVDLAINTLMPEEVTLMLIDFSEFLNLSKSESMSTVVQFMTKYLEIVEQSALLNDGMVVNFEGCRVSIVYNTNLKKSIAEHCNAALCSAFRVVREVDLLIKEFFKSELFSPDIEIRKNKRNGSSIAIVIDCDRALIGNVGIPKLRRFNIIGKINRTVNEMMKMNTSKLDGTECLISRATKGRISSVHKMKTVGYLDEGDKKSSAVYKVLEFKENSVKRNNWLYEISSSDEQSEDDSDLKYGDYESAWNWFFRGDYTNAQRFLDLYAKNNPADNDVEVLAEKLRRAMRVKNF